MVILQPRRFSYLIYTILKKERGRQGSWGRGRACECSFFSLYIRSGWLQVNLSKNTFYYSQTELCYYFKYTSTNTQKCISKKEPKIKIKTSTLNYLSFYKHKRLKYFRGDKNPALLPWSVAFQYWQKIRNYQLK